MIITFQEFLSRFGADTVVRIVHRVSWGKVMKIYFPDETNYMKVVYP